MYVRRFHKRRRPGPQFSFLKKTVWYEKKKKKKKRLFSGARDISRVSDFKRCLYNKLKNTGDMTESLIQNKQSVIL